VADSAKYIATPKKNDEKMRMSAVDAELYLGYKAAYMGIGSVKKMTDPMRCEKNINWIFLSARMVGTSRGCRSPVSL
jgi:hypothetical protein